MDVLWIEDEGQQPIIPQDTDITKWAARVVYLPPTETEPAKYVCPETGKLVEGF